MLSTCPGAGVTAISKAEALIEAKKATTTATNEKKRFFIICSFLMNDWILFFGDSLVVSLYGQTRGGGLCAYTIAPYAALGLPYFISISSRFT